MRDARQYRRLVATAVLVGLAARLVFALVYWRDKPLTHDEREYLTLAANLAAGRGYSLDLPGNAPDIQAERFGRPPGYPAFLALLMRSQDPLAAVALPRSVPARVKIAQSFVGAATVAVIAVLAAWAAGPAAGAVAAWLAALHPPLACASAYALTESLFTLLALAAVATLSLLLDRVAAPRRGAAPVVAFAAGALSAVACLTRGFMLLFVLPAAVVLGWRRGLLAAAAYLVGATLVLAPWTARNIAVHGRFILVSSEGGVNFWIGNHPLAVGEGDMAANPRLKEANADFRQRHPGLTAEQLEPYYFAEAFAWIRNQPLAWLELLSRKAFHLVVPIGPSYRSHSVLYWAGSSLPYLALLPLALAGIRYLRTGPAPPRALGLLVLAWALAGMVFFPQERYRVPAVDPALIVGASAWAAHRIRRDAARRAEPVAETLA